VEAASATPDLEKSGLRRTLETRDICPTCPIGTVVKVNDVTIPKVFPPP
jgi:hypothetical protein